MKKCNICGDNKVYLVKNSFGWRWVCTTCKAYVGCHKGTQVPLGTMADNTLRKYRQQAHFYFDYMWKIKKQNGDYLARKKGYAWLSKQLDIPIVKTHIGMFDKKQCEKVIKICKKYYGRFGIVNG